ncbi:MAG: RNA 2',3'-cyclic phosphodiesterase [Brevefilum sp.]|nr:RNA 2',3'-cyclic phosphodiesterase [Brevefilum sp.]
MRTFVAIDFSPQIRGKIGEIIKYFKTQTPDYALKWVEPQNLHMTIKFLGEISEGHLQTIKDLLSDTIKGRSSFEIEVTGMGMYPSAHKPRVIWLGIEGSGPLKDIHKSLDQALQKASIPPDKRGLSPHLTIARIRRNVETLIVQDIGKTLSQFKIDSLGICTVYKVVLYKSTLTPGGPIYDPLLSIPLDKV